MSDTTVLLNALNGNLEYMSNHRLVDLIRQAADAVTALSAELAEKEKDVKRLEDFAQEFADEPCEYKDNCTAEAIHKNRHYQCYPCKARAAIDKQLGGT